VRCIFCDIECDFCIEPDVECDSPCESAVWEAWNAPDTYADYAGDPSPHASILSDLFDSDYYPGGDIDGDS